MRYKEILVTWFLWKKLRVRLFVALPQIQKFYDCFAIATNSQWNVITWSCW